MEILDMTGAKPWYCACGKTLHYTDMKSFYAVDRLIKQLGPNLRVSTPDGTWLVPRHYIALHGLSAIDLPALALKFHFEQVL